LNDGVPSKAVLKYVKVFNDTVYLGLEGDVMPETPFKIIPNFNNSTSNINIRYDALNVSTMEVNHQKLSMINGWFAFLNGLSFEYKGKPIKSASISSDAFSFVSVSFNSTIRSSAYTTVFSNKSTDIVGLNINHHCSFDNQLRNVIVIQKEYTAETITINNSFSYNNTLGVVKVIDV
jgi:hypothetical protein